MKILIICPLWGYFGGREQYLVDVIEELIRRGHDCSLIYERLTDKPVTSEMISKINKYNIPILSEFETSRDDQYNRVLRSILGQETPDVIFFSDIKNFLLLEQLIEYGKLVAMAHHGWLFCLRSNRIIYLTRNACYRKLGIGCLLQGCFLKKNEKSSGNPLHYNSYIKLHKLISMYLKISAHLVASQYMKNLFLQHGFSDKQVKIIKLFTELPFPIGSPEIRKGNNILFIGRVDRYKGVDLLLKSLYHVQSTFTCNIIGDGPYLAYCKKLARRIKVDKSVKFLGWIPKEETLSYIQRSSLVVVPSIIPEAFGLVGIDAMAFGKPVIAFNNGGISEWLQDGKTGYLIPSKDVVALGNKIDYLLCNPQHAEGLGFSGRKLVEKEFNREKYFDELLNLFNQVSKN